jgi:hypothetical protein
MPESSDAGETLKDLTNAATSFAQELEGLLTTLRPARPVLRVIDGGAPEEA